MGIFSRKEPVPPDSRRDVSMTDRVDFMQARINQHVVLSDGSVVQVPQGMSAKELQAWLREQNLLNYRRY